MESKKAQTQLTESIIVGIIMIILLIIFFSFYYNAMSRNLEIKVMGFKKDSSRARAILIANSPELKCMEYQYCIDIYKVNIIANNNSLKEYYNKTFGTGEIKLEIIYPYEKNITIYSNIPTEVNEEYTYLFPVNVFNASSKNKGIGILKVSIMYK